MSKSTAILWRIVGSRGGSEAEGNKTHHNPSRLDMLNLLERIAHDGDIVASNDGDLQFTPGRRFQIQMEAATLERSTTCSVIR